MELEPCICRDRDDLRQKIESRLYQHLKPFTIEQNLGPILYVLAHNAYEAVYIVSRNWYKVKPYKEPTTSVRVETMLERFRAMSPAEQAEITAKINPIQE